MNRVKIRSLQAALRKAGCVAVSIKGSHEKWQTPEGKTFVLTVNHKNAECCPIALRKIRDALGYIPE